MKRRFGTSLLALFFVCSLTVTTGAAFVQQETETMLSVSVVCTQENSNNKKANEFGISSVKEVLIINGVENNLYPTFDDVHSALQALEKKIPTYYALVDGRVNLAETYESPYNKVMATDFNVDIRNDGATIQPYAVDMTETLNAEKEIFNHFLDLYENNAKNEEIKQYLATTDHPDPEKLAYMLPYNSAFAREYFANVTPAPAAAQSFNEPNGTTYATKWASGRNTLNYPDYSLLGGDCTNFASQILVAGGINMHDQYPDEDSGWWCRKISVGTVNPGTTFKSSISWKQADTFVRFMGTSGNEYTSFYTFSNKVKKGDFIAFDDEKDGDWNHLGYVTATGSNGTYGGKVYRDFRVAQHSRDYHAWVSSETNGWEDLNGSAKFAIVRRNAVA